MAICGQDLVCTYRAMRFKSQLIAKNIKDKDTKTQAWRCELYGGNGIKTIYLIAHSLLTIN